MVSTKVTWIDIQNPTREDLNALARKFGIHEIIIKELEVPSVRTHLEFYENYIYFVYDFPVYNLIDQVSRRAELDFVITRDAVVTVHYDPLEPLLPVKKMQFETPFELLFAILQSTFRFEERELRHIREKVEVIGDELFQDKEKEMLRKISFMKRDISEYRIIVRSAGHTLNSLRDHGVEWWGPSARVYLNDLVSENMKVVSQIEDYREAVDDFERTNSQLMNAKTTQVMKTLTSFSFLTFPFVLFATIFSMRVPGMPFESSPAYAFWIIVGIIVVGIVALAVFFRRKGWL